MSIDDLVIFVAGVGERAPRVESLVGEVAGLRRPGHPRALAAPMHRHTREDECSLRAVLCERRGVRFPAKPLVPLAV